MPGKVTLFYEGQQAQLALKCGIRLQWDTKAGTPIQTVIYGQRWSDSPNEAHVALLQTLGQHYVTLSEESGRHENRALELEAQLGDAIRSVEIFRDENQEFKDVLLEKDERILDLEDQISNLRKQHDELMTSSTRQWQLRGEAGVKALNAEDRVKELEEQLAERDRQIAESNAFTRDQSVRIAALQVDQELLVKHLEKLLVLAKVVIDSSKKEE